MILGSYYLTHPGVQERNTYAEKGDGKVFTNLDEMLMAYQTGVVGIHAKVKVRMYKNDQDSGKLVESTAVSYTHLDVYKRQELCILIQQDHSFL